MTPPFPNSPRPAWYRQAQWKASNSKRNGVHYVGDDVIIDLTFPTPSYDTFKRTASFEGGVDGGTITSTDRDYYSNISFIQGSPTYSSTHAYGDLSMKIAGAATDTSVRWDYTAHADQFFRIYLYATAYPTGYCRISSGQYWGLLTDSTGKLYLSDQFAGHFNLTTPFSLNQWVRIEWHVNHYGVNEAELRLYNDPDSSTPTQSASDTSFAGAADGLSLIGPSIASWGADVWYDNFVARANAWPGPYQLFPPVANPITYDVKNFYGDTVSSGEFEEGHEWFRPEPPSGGWKPGWYRVYLTGTQTITNFKNSYGVTNFCVIKDDAHFVTMPAGNVVGGYNAEYGDYVMKGVMGLGTSRLLISNTNNPTTGIDTLAQAEQDAVLASDYWIDNGIPDAERPAREVWCLFANGSVDYLWMGGVSSYEWAQVYPLTSALDSSQIFIELTNGTNPSTDKLRVYYPDASTLVETFDNLVNQYAAQTTINASSNYIRVFGHGGTTRAIQISPTVIGSDFHDGVVLVVSTLYPLGVTRYEGPYNEPAYNTETVHQMRLFQGSVHEGHASAKAIGPSVVSIGSGYASVWGTMLAAGLGDWCDEISFHAYNAVPNGDMNCGRSEIQSLLDTLDSYGQGSKPLWQSESTSAMTAVYGAYHPRRSRKPVMETLLFEQLGIPKERNNWWYDVSHGYNDVPEWLENGDGSLEPAVVLGRVLAEEIWGKPYVSALDFGTLGNAIYIGNVYTNAAGASTVALMATSFMPGASVALTITGTASAITVVDGFGNEKAMPQSKGRITIPMTDVPAYVRLPIGASASVYRINGWSPLGTGSSVSPSATTKQIDGVTQTVIADGGWMTRYVTSDGVAPATFATTPSTCDLIWTSPTSIERVIVWAGVCFSISGTLMDFDVQTYDGSNWTTRKTVTKPAPQWFLFGSDGSTSACFLESYWDEQWIFDVEFDSAVTCRGVRLNVREASYGGESISDTTYGTSFGQGNNVEGYKIQEIAVVDSNRYAGVG